MTVACEGLLGRKGSAAFFLGECAMAMVSHLEEAKK